MRILILPLNLLLILAASAAAFTPARPVSRWSTSAPSSAQSAPLLRSDEFARVRIDTMISAIRYLFMPTQAVLVSPHYLHGNPAFFFGYAGMEGNVRTVVFPESSFLDPASWTVQDVYQWSGPGSLKHACPSAFWSDSAATWYPQVAFKADPPIAMGFLYDHGGIDGGVWGDPVPIDGTSLHLPMITTGPDNIVYMIGEDRDAFGGRLVFKSFDGWTGHVLDPPGEVTLFPGEPMFGQGYENYQLLHQNGRIVVARGAYRSDDFSDPNNPLLIVFTESYDGGLTWSDPVWLDKDIVPDLPGSIPGIQGHYSNSFFDGLIDDMGRLHFLALVADSGWFGNETSGIWGMYDICETELWWVAHLASDGIYSSINPREFLEGDTWMHSPSLALVALSGRIVAAWNDIAAVDPDSSVHIGIWVTWSDDCGSTWSEPLCVASGQSGGEYFSRLVPTGSRDPDSEYWPGSWNAYVLTMPTGGLDGPLDMIRAPWPLGGGMSPPVEPSLLRSVKPMPCDRQAVFRLHLPASCHVDVAVFTLDGRRVKALQRGELPRGVHVLTWDCAQIPSGAYVCRVVTGETIESRRIVVMH